MIEAVSRQYDPLTDCVQVGVGEPGDGPSLVEYEAVVLYTRPSTRLSQSTTFLVGLEVGGLLVSIHGESLEDCASCIVQAKVVRDKDRRVVHVAIHQASSLIPGECG